MYFKDKIAPVQKKVKILIVLFYDIVSTMSYAFIGVALFSNKIAFP